MYIQQTCTCKFCVADVPCTDGYIYFMDRTGIVELGTYTAVYPFGCSFFIHPAGWPVGWDWLLPGFTPIQVQAHEFNRHQPDGLPALSEPPPARLP